ncbi:peptidoglycan-binding protein [Bosea sp. NPDC055594]
MKHADAQRALIALGYNLGRGGPSGKGDDDIWGWLSQTACAAFQRGRGLSATGRLDSETIKALQAAVAEKGPVAVVPAVALVTVDCLAAIATSFGARPNSAVLQGIVDNRDHLAEGGIVSPGRLSEFFAQACLETNYFRVLEEYASGKAYEGRKTLGNTVAGDGVRFKGRGIFQCTGRANYASYGRRLGVDLLKEPQLASRPDISVRIAVLYWNDHGLNSYADRRDTRAISRAINRGDPKAKKAANHEAARVLIAGVAGRLFGA